MTRSELTPRAWLDAFLTWPMLADRSSDPKTKPERDETLDYAESFCMLIRRILPVCPRLFATLASLIVMSLGCGDDGGIATRYPVSGKVTYKGAPIKKASINFIPNDPEGRPAGGKIEDGQYVLTTVDSNDGAIPGKYKVTVDDRELDRDAMRASADAEAKKKGVDYVVIPQHLQAGALKKMKSSLPGKYQIASTSDLEVEVKNASNTLDLELKD